jgi:hypothetical protein
MAAETRPPPVGDRRRIAQLDDTRCNPASRNPDVFVTGKQTAHAMFALHQALCFQPRVPTIVTARSVVMVMVNTLSDICALFTRRRLLETPSATMSFEEFPSHLAAFPPTGRGRFTADPRCRACPAASVCDDNQARDVSRTYCRRGQPGTCISIRTAAPGWGSVLYRKSDCPAGYFIYTGRWLDRGMGWGILCFSVTWEAVRWGRVPTRHRVRRAHDSAGIPMSATNTGGRNRFI